MHRVVGAAAVLLMLFAMASATDSTDTALAMQRERLEEMLSDTGISMSDLQSLAQQAEALARFAQTAPPTQMGSSSGSAASLQSALKSLNSMLSSSSHSAVSSHSTFSGGSIPSKKQTTIITDKLPHGGCYKGSPCAYAWKKSDALPPSDGSVRTDPDPEMERLRARTDDAVRSVSDWIKHMTFLSGGDSDIVTARVAVRPLVARMKRQMERFMKELELDGEKALAKIELDATNGAYRTLRDLTNGHDLDGPDADNAIKAAFSTASQIIDKEKILLTNPHAHIDSSLGSLSSHSASELISALTKLPPTPAESAHSTLEHLISKLEHGSSSSSELSHLAKALNPASGEPLGSSSHVESSISHALDAIKAGLKAGAIPAHEAHSSSSALHDALAGVDVEEDSEQRIRHIYQLVKEIKGDKTPLPWRPTKTVPTKIHALINTLSAYLHHSESADAEQNLVGAIEEAKHLLTSPDTESSKKSMVEQIKDIVAFIGKKSEGSSSASKARFASVNLPSSPEVSHNVRDLVGDFQRSGAANNSPIKALQSMIQAMRVKATQNHHFDGISLLEVASSTESKNWQRRGSSSNRVSRDTESSGPLASKLSASSAFSFLSAPSATDSTDLPVPAVPGSTFFSAEDAASIASAVDDALKRNKRSLEVEESAKLNSQTMDRMRLKMAEDKLAHAAQKTTSDMEELHARMLEANRAVASEDEVTLVKARHAIDQLQERIQKDLRKSADLEKQIHEIRSRLPKPEEGSLQTNFLTVLQTLGKAQQGRVQSKSKQLEETLPVLEEAQNELSKELFKAQDHILQEVAPTIIGQSPIAESSLANVLTKIALAESSSSKINPDTVFAAENQVIAKLALLAPQQKALVLKHLIHLLETVKNGDKLDLVKAELELSRGELSDIQVDGADAVSKKIAELKKEEAKEKAKIAKLKAKREKLHESLQTAMIHKGLSEISEAAAATGELSAEESHVIESAEKELLEKLHSLQSKRQHLENESSHHEASAGELSHHESGSHAESSSHHGGKGKHKKESSEASLHLTHSEIESRKSRHRKVILKRKLLMKKIAAQKAKVTKVKEHLEKEKTAIEKLKVEEKHVEAQLKEARKEAKEALEQDQKQKKQIALQEKKIQGAANQLVKAVRLVKKTRQKALKDRARLEELLGQLGEVDSAAGVVDTSTLLAKIEHELQHDESEVSGAVSAVKRVSQILKSEMSEDAKARRKRKATKEHVEHAEHVIAESTQKISELSEHIHELSLEQSGDQGQSAYYSASLEDSEAALRAEESASKAKRKHKKHKKKKKSEATEGAAHESAEAMHELSQASESALKHVLSSYSESSTYLSSLKSEASAEHASHESGHSSESAHSESSHSEASAPSSSFLETQAKELAGSILSTLAKRQQLRNAGEHHHKDNSFVGRLSHLLYGDHTAMSKRMEERTPSVTQVIRQHIAEGDKKVAKAQELLIAASKTLDPKADHSVVGEIKRQLAEGRTKVPFELKFHPLPFVKRLQYVLDSNREPDPLPGVKLNTKLKSTVQQVKDVLEEGRRHEYDDFLA